VADFLDPMSDDSEIPSILANITEKQDYYKEHYLLAEEAAAAEKFAELRSQLIDKVNGEYQQYNNGLRNLDMAELTENSDFIDSVDNARKYLTEHQNYTADDLEFLLNLDNTLVVVADQVHEMPEENIGFPILLDFLKDNYADIYAEKPVITVAVRNRWLKIVYSQLKNKYVR